MQTVVKLNTYLVGMGDRHVNCARCLVPDRIDLRRLDQHQAYPELQVETFS